MRNNLWTRGLVIGIIMLFVGTSVLPSISGDIEIGKNRAVSQKNATSSVSTTDWWPMFQHDLSHSGYSTSTAPETNNVLWDYTTGNEVRSSPAVADGKVYIGSLDYKVYCLNAETGTKIWDFTTGGYVTSSPAVADGKVYIGSWGSSDNKIYCLNAETGLWIWDYTATVIYVYSSPAVANGKVYIGASNKIYCLNADTGAKIWDYTTGNEVRSSPAVADGKVYIGSLDYKVYCLNAETGTKIWDFTTGGYVDSTPAVTDGKVYIGSCGYKVYCLDANTGAKIWDYTADHTVSSSPAVANEKVYVGSRDNKVYCLNANTGVNIWNYTTGSDVLSSPAVADGKVYIGSCDGTVYCFGSAGNQQHLIKPVDGSMICPLRGYYKIKEIPKGDPTLDTLAYKYFHEKIREKTVGNIVYEIYKVFHEGIDIDGLMAGHPVNSTATGTILWVDNKDNSPPGKYVWIQHENIQKLDGTTVSKISTRYLHLKTIDTNILQHIPNPTNFQGAVNIPITQGTIIGTVGNTGCPTTKEHLHFEVREGDIIAVNYDYRNTLPLNPCDFVCYDECQNPYAMWILTSCPVDLTVTDPDGLIINKDFNQLPSSEYVEIKYDNSVEDDLSLQNYDSVILFDRKLGDYLINIVPEQTANPTDTYNLQVITKDSYINIAQNVQISNIPDEPYIVKSNESGIYAAPIPAFTYLPENPFVYQLITFNASISTDPDGYITNWTWDFGDGSTSILQNPTHKYNDDRTYHVRFTVTDNDGLRASLSKDVVVSNIPLVADAGGPYYGYTRTDIWFNGSAVDGEPPYYFSWDLDDDGEYDDAYGDVAHNSYDSPGVYTISLKVRDNDWQYSINTTQVTVRTNNTIPNKPSQPSGQTNGKIGQEYSYTTSTTDPDGDQVYYLWDWGDGNNSGWLGPCNSGVTINTAHNWTVKGSYSIKVKAKDTFGAESPWSDPLPITMPYSYNPLLQFLDLLFQRFPHAFPILRHLLGY